MCRSIFSLLLVLMAMGHAVGQQPTDPPPADTTTVEVAPKAKVHPYDTIRQPFRPTGIRVGTDVISIVKSYKTNTFTGWEVNGDIDFYRYYFAFDYGHWARTEDLDNGHYTNDGSYFRLGADVNFLLKDPDRNMVFIGFRYGHSTFNEHLSFQYDATPFGTVSTTISSPGVTGHWGELVTGLRVKIWGGFWMGYTARMKFAPGAKGKTTMTPYDMPGYGLVSKAPYWGFNYQLFWKFPLPGHREKEAVDEKKE